MMEKVKLVFQRELVDLLKQIINDDESFDWENLDEMYIPNYVNLLTKAFNGYKYLDELQFNDDLIDILCGMDDNHEEALTLPSDVIIWRNENGEAYLVLTP